MDSVSGSEVWADGSAIDAFPHQKDVAALWIHPSGYRNGRGQAGAGRIRRLIAPRALIDPGGVYGIRVVHVDERILVIIGVHGPGKGQLFMVAEAGRGGGL